MPTTIQCFVMDSLDAAVQAQLNGTSPRIIISPGWVREPNVGRGTMDIVWSCLITIFACSWTVTHPDIPRKGEWATSKMWLCFMAVVAPEWMAVVAYEEYLRARQHSKAIGKITKSQWTMSQAFFVGMGGLELEFEDCTEILGRDCGSNSSFKSNYASCFNSNYALSVFQRAVQLKKLEVKSISAEDIRKRAKTNYIVKALVCLQALWLVAQVIGRAVAQLPITTLEVVTVGYVVCALITYFCSWHKPQDAEVYILVKCKNLTKANFHQQVDAEEEDEPLLKRLWEKPLGCVVGNVVTVIFGAVHCTAWNFFFSTVAESITWKVASVLNMVTPAIFCGIYHSLPENDTSRTWVKKIMAVVASVYIPVRLYLMIEPFVAFRSVPIGIFYTVNWSSWIPHV
jgi:hypothetical protein